MSNDARWYHAHIDAVSRSDGKSAVGLVSYITGRPLLDEETGRWCKRNHPGEVLDWGTVIPEFAPSYLADKEHLGKAWNDVQRSETRKNSHLANHWNLASCGSFSEQDHIDTAIEIATRIRDRYGVMVTWGVHKPTDHGDDRNWHIHIAYNMREVGHDGFGAKVRRIVAKETRSDEARWQRQMFADVMNDKMQELSIDERVSPLSYAERGIDRKPTKHLGNEQNKFELEGIPTMAGSYNRDARTYNELKDEHAQITAQIYDLDQERERRQAMSATTEHRPTHQPEALKVEPEIPAMEPLTDDDMHRQAINIAGGRRQMELIDKQQGYSIRSNIEEAAKQAEQAKKDDQAQKEYEKQRAEVGEPVDANARYAAALGQCFSIRDPYTTLANTAMVEYQLLQRELQERNAAIAEETDPEKIAALKNANDIAGHEYMARTSGELAAISRAITRGDNDGARKDDWNAARHAAWALKLKGDLKGYREEKERAGDIKIGMMLHNLANDVGKGTMPRDMTPDQRDAYIERLARASGDENAEELIASNREAKGRQANREEAKAAEKTRREEEIATYGHPLTDAQRKAVDEYAATAAGQETPEQVRARQTEESHKRDGLMPDKPVETGPQTTPEERATTPAEAREEALANYAKTARGELTGRETPNERTDGNTSARTGTDSGRGGGRGR